MKQISNGIRARPEIRWIELRCIRFSAETGSVADATRCGRYAWLVFKQRDPGWDRVNELSATKTNRENPSLADRN